MPPTTPGDGRPTCRRPNCCGAVYQDHAPGGGACLVWDPDTDWHCPCRGFQWVALSGPITPGDATVPAGNRRFR